MLDAGVHLSDKRTLRMKTHIQFKTHYKIFYPNPLLALTNGEETTDFIISMNVLRPLECNEQIKYAF